MPLQRGLSTCQTISNRSTFCFADSRRVKSVEVAAVAICSRCGARTDGETCPNSFCSCFGQPLSGNAPSRRQEIATTPKRIARKSRADSSEVFDGPRLRRIAAYQRGVMFAMLATVPGNLLLGIALTQSPQIAVPLAVVSTSIALLLVVFVFLFAKSVYSVDAAIVSSILMFVPGISLLVLVVLNQSAIGRLRSAGVVVGFFGASAEAVDRALALPGTEMS